MEKLYNDLPSYLVIYRKPDGSIKEHYVGFPCNREVGEITSSGLEVIDIQVFDKGKLIKKEEYDKDISLKIEKSKKQKPIERIRNKFFKSDKYQKIIIDKKGNYHYFK